MVMFLIVCRMRSTKNKQPLIEMRGFGLSKQTRDKYISTACSYVALIDAILGGFQEPWRQRNHVKTSFSKHKGPSITWSILKGLEMMTNWGHNIDEETGKWDRKTLVITEWWILWPCSTWFDQNTFFSTCCAKLPIILK